MNSFARFAQFYNRSFQTSPALTLALTNGFLSGFADIVAQSSQNIVGPKAGGRKRPLFQLDDRLTRLVIAHLRSRSIHSSSPPTRRTARAGTSREQCGSSRSALAWAPSYVMRERGGRRKSQARRCRSCPLTDHSRVCYSRCPFNLA